MSSDQPEVVGLAEVIRTVREDLQQAQDEGAGERLRFTVEKVSLEIAVQVRKEGSGRAGLRIGVVTADAGGSVGKDTTHRIQVELQPHWGDGSDLVGGAGGRQLGGGDW
jgi:hypothetical protein